MFSEQYIFGHWFIWKSPQSWIIQSNLAMSVIHINIRSKELQVTTNPLFLIKYCILHGTAGKIQVWTLKIAAMLIPRHQSWQRACDLLFHSLEEQLESDSSQLQGYTLLDSCLYRNIIVAPQNWMETLGMRLHADNHHQRMKLPL